MKRRAAQSKDPVCAAWAKDYKAFRAWALSSGYAPGLVFQCKDDTIGYSPKNCGWATKGQMQYATKKRKDASGSRFKGVSWCKARRLWLMQITKEGVQHTALFPTEREAAAPTTKRLSSFSENSPARISQGRSDRVQGPVARERRADSVFSPPKGVTVLLLQRREPVDWGPPSAVLSPPKGSAVTRRARYPRPAFRPQNHRRSSREGRETVAATQLESDFGRLIESHRRQDFFLASANSSGENFESRRARTS